MQNPHSDQTGHESNYGNSGGLGYGNKTLGVTEHGQYVSGTDADDQYIQQVPLNPHTRTDTGMFSTKGTYEGNLGIYHHGTDPPDPNPSAGYRDAGDGIHPKSEGYFHDPEPQRVFKPYSPFIISLIISAVLLGAIVGLVRGTEKRGTLDSIDKYIYNALIIFLSLALGTNLASAYQHFAQLVKYGILAMPTEYEWSLRQDPLFRQIIGLRTVLRYILRGLPAIGKTRYSLLFTSLWLFFNLATAVGISLIGLTYSLDSLGSKTVGEKPGITSVVNLSHFYPSPHFNVSLLEDPVERFSAKLYGDVSTGYKVLKPSESSEHDEFNTVDMGNGWWKYQFKNMDKPGGLMRMSNRFIYAHAKCESFKIVSSIFGLGFNYTDAAGELQYQAVDFMHGATTYYSRSKDAGDVLRWNLETFGCADGNPRCAAVHVAQFTTRPEDDNWFYSCESTVETVQGAEKSEEMLSDRQAKIAAAAISHSGVLWQILDEEGEVIENEVMEFAYYMDGVVWGEMFKGDASRMANTIAKFAVGCLAATDQLNPRVDIMGMRPWAGVALSVKWWRLNAVIFAIFGVQLVGGAFCLIWWMYATKGKKAAMEPVVG